jgi:hypothetical protein
MNPKRTDGPTPADETSYALLRLDDLRLLVPQHDIRLLEPSVDMEMTDPPAGGIGWMTFRQQHVPVFSLSAGLRWQAEAEKSYAICALLEAEGRFFGLLCTEVGLLGADEVAFHEIPRAMTMPHAPFHRLALHGEHLACVSSASRIFAFLPSQETGIDRVFQESL